MRKAIIVLALIAFACDISRDVLVHGDPARKPEAAGRNDGYEYQTELHGQFDDVEMSRRIAEDRERSGEPVGKWRSNGEALEPKWRDGDAVPLLPFSHYRSYSRDAVDDVEDFPATSGRRPLKHRYSTNRPNRPRESPGGQVPADDYDYEATYRDYSNPDENYARRRRRPLKSSTLHEEAIESAASSDGMRDRDLASDTLNDEVTSRYREAFQARPDEYEHEFNDEEYLRPRPRKRRPPQNYEFALANEASDEENEESRDPAKLPSQKKIEDLPTTTRSYDDERKNALELKSLLKMQQQEGLSLLEILQRKNLTLNDLLKGKADVINALKSRMADESDEYVEEMSRVMSNSLMKLAATATLPWRLAQTSTAPESTTARIVATSSSPDNSMLKTTIVPRNASESYDVASANDANSVKNEPKDVERKMQSARDFPRLRATTPAIVTTVITTSASPPDAMSSMEYLLNDDGNAESTSDRAIKLDEDEIMEFSDFTDFTKKGKSPTASSWSNPPGETVGARDTESTLSIERILNPTERIGLTKDRENAEAADGEAIRNGDRSVPTGEPSAEDYNAFVEAEYQNDAPVDIPEDSVGRGIMGDDSRASESHASSADERKEMPRDKNHSSEYHRVDQSAREKPRNHEEHASDRRYEDVVSEIEPEARAEIFELFASGSAGRRLERLLKSRNMSVEELIALRQRGSSRVHLTEVSRLKVSRNPPTLETSNTNKGETTIPFSKDSHEHFGARIKALEKDSARQEVERPTNQFKDIMSYLHNPFLDKDEANMSRLLDLAERDRDASRASAENKYKPENSDRTIVNLLTPFGSFAKDLQQQFEEEMKSEESKANIPIGNDDNNTSTMLIDEERKTVPLDNSSELHAGYVEEIITGEAPTTIEIRTIYDETASRAGGEDERKTLSRIRPSIIASGAILGVTIVVFLAIFIVCRIRQKQRYTYRNTFSRAVFQGPVMAARKLSNSSSLSTVMVNVVATSTAKRPERMETQVAEEFDGKCDMDNDSLDANDSWETIPDYAK